MDTLATVVVIVAAITAFIAGVLYERWTGEHAARRNAKTGRYETSHKPMQPDEPWRDPR